MDNGNYATTTRPDPTTIIEVMMMMTIRRGREKLERNERERERKRERESLCVCNANGLLLHTLLMGLDTHANREKTGRERARKP